MAEQRVIAFIARPSPVMKLKAEPRQISAETLPHTLNRNKPVLLKKCCCFMYYPAISWN